MACSTSSNHQLFALSLYFLVILAPAFASAAPALLEVPHFFRVDYLAYFMSVTPPHVDSIAQNPNVMPAKMA